MTSFDIRGICISGGNVVVSANNFSSLDLKGIALIAKAHGVRVTIKNASILTPLTCKGIALAGGIGTVTFDFSE